MRRAFTRLRWQLTLSHLIAIAFTLICMIAATVVIVTLVIAFESHRRNEAAKDARTVARIVGGLVIRDQPAELSIVLGALADGSLRVLGVENEGPPWRPGTGAPL